MKNRLSVGHRIFLYAIIVAWVLPGGLLFANEEKKGGKIPSLEETLQIVFKKNSSVLAGPGQKASLSRAEAEFKVKQHYYRILYKNEQLKIAEEVKKHFEKAVTKSQEKYDEGEDDISQSDITKLKLGLAGTENDIASLKSGIELAKVSLGRMLGWDITQENPTTEKNIRAVQFSFFRFADYLSGRKPGNNPPNAAGEKRFILKKAFIKVNEAREKMKLAKKIKKITRALLVTEVANYDFGIGDSQDLFEALIIYTRVLKGFYETIYNFNMAVADLDKIENLPSPP